MYWARPQLFLLIFPVAVFVTVAAAASAVTKCLYFVCFICALNVILIEMKTSKQNNRDNGYGSRAGSNKNVSSQTKMKKKMRIHNWNTKRQNEL